MLNQRNVCKFRKKKQNTKMDFYSCFFLSHVNADSNVLYEMFLCEKKSFYLYN